MSKDVDRLPLWGRMKFFGVLLMIWPFVLYVLADVVGLILPWVLVIVVLLSILKFVSIRRRW